MGRSARQSAALAVSAEQESSRGFPTASESAPNNRRRAKLRRNVPIPSEPETDRQSWREDHQLVARFLAGDAASRRAVCERLQCVPRILRALNRRLEVPLAPDALEDVSQETIVVVWNKLPEFEGRARLESWLYRFCFLTLMNHARREQRQRQREAPLGAAAPVGVDAEFPGRLARAESIEFGLARLDATDCAVLRLRFYEELSFRGIAERLEMSPNTARHHYQRGLSRLRTLVGSKKSGDSK